MWISPRFVNNLQWLFNYLMESMLRDGQEVYINYPRLTVDNVDKVDCDWQNFNLSLRQ